MVLFFLGFKDHGYYFPKFVCVPPAPSGMETTFFRLRMGPIMVESLVGCGGANIAWVGSGLRWLGFRGSSVDVAGAKVMVMSSSTSTPLVGEAASPPGSPLVPFVGMVKSSSEIRQSRQAGRFEGSSSQIVSGRVVGYQSYLI
jgi:hypothetical protein